MKTKITLIFLLCGIFYTEVIYAQENCKYLYDKVDDFTKERAVSTKYLRIYISGRGKHAAAAIIGTALGGGISARKEELFFGACNIGGKNILAIRIRTTDSRSTFFASYYQLLLQNGEQAKVWRIDEGQWGDIATWGGEAGWSTFLLGVDEKSWSNLRTSGVKKIRIPEGDKYNFHDIEINEDDADVIKKGIHCIESLNIEHVTYEQDPNVKEKQSSSDNSQISNNKEKIPDGILSKKWHNKYTTSNGKTEIETTFEFLATYECVGTTKIGDQQPTEWKQKISFANNGKYILWYSDNGEPHTSEILSLDDKVIILKSLSDGKVYVYNSL